jgi:hypothetical protein
MNENNQTLALEPVRPMPLAAADSQQSIMSVIARAASDPNVDVGKMERLYAMLKEEKAAQAEQKFNESMREVQMDMPRIVKDRENSHTKSRYVQLETLSKAAVPIYTANGFSLIFSEGESPNTAKIRVMCEVKHEAGHSRSYHLDLSPDDKGSSGNSSKTKIHGEGSTFSYGQRYLMKLIFNLTIVGEDDDGNQGNKKKPEGASSLGGAVDDRAMKRKLVDLTREDSGIVGYGLTDTDKDNISQHLIDENFITPEETLATLAGKRLAEVVAKLEARAGR